MGEHLADQVVRGRHADERTAEPLTYPVQALEWAGVVLPEIRLFGCRLTPVVVLDRAVHEQRMAGGDGPQLDEDTLAVWEWPDSAGWAPAPALHLTGTLSTARRGWRGAVSQATRWRAFAPAAVLVACVGEIDQVCRWECALHGVGLVPLPSSGPSGPDIRRGDPGAIVGAEPGRRAPARRRTADRWVEETLYARALDVGAYLPAPTT